jgi:hypothetical protein
MVVLVDSKARTICMVGALMMQRVGATVSLGSSCCLSILSIRLGVVGCGFLVHDVFRRSIGAACRAEQRAAERRRGALNIIIHHPVE